MMLEPAQRAGDAPRTASEQGPSPDSPHPPVPSDDEPSDDEPSDDVPSAEPPSAEPSTRLLAPTREARLRTEREQWGLRRSLERQLHDGAALRISALTLQLGLLRHRAADCDLHTSIDGVQDELHAVLQELRDVAGKIYPPLLDEAGLGPALREAADRMNVPVRVDAPADRFGPAPEGAAYFAVVGCMEAATSSTATSSTATSSTATSSTATSSTATSSTATSSTAPGTSLDVVVRREDHTLAVDVVGVELRHADAMLGAVRRLDGVIDVAGGPHAGTITVRIPCE